MGKFHLKPQRSIEEILTPKSEKETVEVYDGEIESEEVSEAESDIVSAVSDDEIATNEVEAPIEVKPETKPKSSVEIKDSALDCFGWKEDKTERWLVLFAKIWYIIMSFIWFLVGAVTFAPIIFMSNKVNAIFSDKRKSLFAAIGIYALIIAIIVIIIMTHNIPKIATQ